MNDMSYNLNKNQCKSRIYFLNHIKNLFFYLDETYTNNFA